MTRTILAIATVFFAVMTVFASAAEACVSCSYVPAVAHSPSKSYGAKRHTKKRIHRAANRRKARPTKKRIANRKTTAKKVETAKTAPIKTDTKNENSTISTASLDNSETIDTEETATEEPKVNRNLGCKKFFPSVGMTLTVPCE